MAGTTTNYLFFDGHVVSAPPGKMDSWKFWGFLAGKGSDKYKLQFEFTISVTPEQLYLPDFEP